jgi:arabinose-5-phosphate isomerase
MTLPSQYVEQARRVLRIEIAELQRLATRLDDHFDRAVERLLAVLDAGNKVVTLGVGKSGDVGRKIASTLTSTGSPAVILDVTNALHGDLGIVADGDAVLALSYSGETAELLNLLPALKRFDVQIIAFTGNPSSTLARHSDVVLNCGVAAEACPLNLAPTSSTTVMLALGDALAMVLLEARGFQKEDFAKFHPAGRLGRVLLQKVRDVMRPPERMPKVKPAPVSPADGHTAHAGRGRPGEHGLTVHPVRPGGRVPLPARREGRRRIGGSPPGPGRSSQPVADDQHDR